MRRSLLVATLGGIVACAASQPPSSSWPPGSSNATAAAAAATASTNVQKTPDAAERASAPHSLLEDAPPLTFDPTLPRPETGDLRGIGDHEAWVSFGAAGREPYDAIVDLDSGCVTSTFGWQDPASFFNGFPTPSDEPSYIAIFLAKKFHDGLATKLSLLARFPRNKIGDTMVLGHSDGAVALGTDRHVLAVGVGSRVYISTDGGLSFRRSGHRTWTQVSQLRFVAGDRFLTLSTSLNDGSTADLVSLLDVTRDDGDEAVRAQIDTSKYNGTAIAMPDSRLLFVQNDSHCLAVVDPRDEQPALTPLACDASNGAKAKTIVAEPFLSPSGRYAVEMRGTIGKASGEIVKLDRSEPARALPGTFAMNGFFLGPDDDGDFVWESKGTLHEAMGDQVFDHKTKERPIGFAPQGDLLVFHASDRGTLGDVKCTSIQRLHLRKAAPSR